MNDRPSFLAQIQSDVANISAPNYPEAQTLSDLKNFFPNELINELIIESGDYLKEYQLMLSIINVYKSYIVPDNLEFLSNLAAAILLEINRLYPELKATIIFRPKTERSFINNFNKTLINKHIYYDDLYQFFEDLFKDVLGLKLIISAPEQLATLLDSKYNEFNIQDLIYESIANSQVATDALLFVRDSNRAHSKDDYCDKYNSVLEKLKNTIYPEETKLLDRITNKYPMLNKAELLRTITPEQFTDLQYLADLLQNRSSDKLLNRIAERILLKVCSEQLISHSLQVKCDIEKAKEDTQGWSRKESSFMAFFTSIHSALLSSSDISAEGQVENDFRYSIDRGSHNNNEYDPSKKVEIKHLFTLTEPTGDIELDKKNLNHLLEQLEMYSIKDIDKPEVQDILSQIQIDKEKVKQKINNSIEEDSEDDIEGNLRKEEYSYLHEDTSYLRSFISPSLHYLSPRMHIAELKNIGDEINPPTVVIKKESIVDCFKDVLRKDDEISILDSFLIHYLQDTYPELSNPSETDYTRDSIEEYALINQPDNPEK